MESNNNNKENSNNNNNKINITSLNQTDHKIQWCPGCGDFGILFAIKRAIINLQINPKDVVVVSGIGCSGKLPHYIKTYGFETLHGRALPVATGIKFANPNLHVIVVAGDGDGYGIGIGHLIHSIRRDINLTYIVHNNNTYGLTKGQASPTTKINTKTSSTPYGVVESPLNPLALSISLNCNFVARGYSQDMPYLSTLIEKAITHVGFSIIDIIQPCISYDYLEFKKNKLEISKLENENHDTKNKFKAFEIANLFDRKIGIFYQKENSQNNQKKENLVNLNIENINIDQLIKNYK